VRMSSVWLVFKPGFFLLQGEHVAAVPAQLGAVLRHGTDSNGLCHQYNTARERSMMNVVMLNADTHLLTYRPSANQILPKAELSNGQLIE
jgi:hypothetical protein